VANDLGAKEFTLWADPEAEGFYAKMGCKKIGVKKSPFMPDRYPPIMRFKLQPQVT
jgi:streptomycin 6-kinase